MTAAYAFTDYRAQGQTIPFVIVDIATPPSGGLSLFNLYVALSRSKGRSSIRLLRDFDNKVFQAGHSPELLAENDRLDKLDHETLHQLQSTIIFHSEIHHPDDRADPYQKVNWVRRAAWETMSH
ncbi:hypothetical protein EDD15DRAFT_2251075 [Pisolithus albus]|nr:hypothetical protein EDD15DRAFT_2251075 [Pisolithus albus]